MSISSFPHLTRTNSAKMFEWPAMRGLQSQSRPSNSETMISFPTPLILNSPPPKQDGKEQPKDYWLTSPSLTITIQPATPTPSPRDDTSYFPAVAAKRDKVQDTASEQRILGTQSNYWIFQRKPRCLFDLTRPEVPSPFTKQTANIKPRRPFVEMKTTSHPILVQPEKTTLLVVDMTNGPICAGDQEMKQEEVEARDSALRNLRSKGIAAARKAGIQVLWLGWGLEDEDLTQADPQWERRLSLVEQGNESDALVGEDMGKCQTRVVDENGDVVKGKHKTIEQGRRSMRGSWNTELFPSMQKAFEEGQRDGLKYKDKMFYKRQAGGLGEGKDGDLLSFLRERGITTILAAGVLTEMCVWSTLQEAALKGFDTVLLRDSCVKRDEGQQTMEEACRHGCGFASSCEWLEQGVADIKR